MGLRVGVEIRPSFIAAILHLLLCALFAGVPGRPLLAASPDLTVSVTGTGATIDDAKTDAIRRALQRTMKQLVVVDRIVNQDTMLLNKVMSTMNGYIETFRQKGVRKTEMGFAVDAEVTVSA